MDRGERPPRSAARPVLPGAARNTTAIKVKPAAASGYKLFASATSGNDIGPGDELLIKRNDNLPDVGPTAKDIPMTRPDLDAIYDVQLGTG